MIQITCKGNSAICTRTERLTSGMVGLQCEFVFDGAWDGLARTAVFTAGNEKRDVLLTGDTCTVPWEVLKTAGYQLVIGVYGTNAAGTLVIPTVYAMCGGIASGADPSGDESTDPTLPVWGQMQGMIGNLENLATSSKDNLVAAINEAAQSGGGGGASVELDTTLTQSGKAADAKAVGDALAGKQPSGDYLTQNELQAATDAALAQAKESGEFDGADGITPNIGDNGNWYLGATDTGKPSRGDKGDPGDTPDMTAYRTAEAQNVIDAGKQDTLIQSGATVGQIAKITAVDDSGKPTAWEAVDMPSGGGGASYRSWSKVWTLAVAEDIAGFTASNIDLDGKSEIMIVFISDSTASRTMVNGRLRINGVDAGKVLFNSLPLKKDSHSFVIIGRADVGIEYTTMQATAEYQTYPWQGEVKIVHRMVSGTGSIIQWTAGSTIEITQASATLGQGITIEIYVR